MNLRVLAISMAIVFFVIAVHQTMNFGLYASYWAFSLSGLFFLGYMYLKRRFLENGGDQPKAEKKGPKKRERKYKVSRKNK